MPLRRWTSALLALALFRPAVAAAEEFSPIHDAALDSLVNAERAFAGRSAEKGMRDAFLEFLAPDGVIFRPLATNGRRSWEARGPVAATLLWEPHYAEVSAAGDLGYTTGPWELRPGDSPTAAAHGHFVSVWQKQPDGAWRVAVDLGVSHGKPARGLGSLDFDAGPAHAMPKRAAPPADLAALDLAWTREARTKGSAAAFARWAAPDVRFYRDLVAPVKGVPAGSEMLKNVPGVTLWTPQAQRISTSNDLGCTYGIVERPRLGGAPPDSGVYLHIWRRDAAGRWKAALTVESPLPESGRK